MFIPLVNMRCLRSTRGIEDNNIRTMYFIAFILFSFVYITVSNNTNFDWPNRLHQIILYIHIYSHYYYSRIIKCCRRIYYNPSRIAVVVVVVFCLRTIARKWVMEMNSRPIISTTQFWRERTQTMTRGNSSICGGLCVCVCVCLSQLHF